MMDPRGQLSPASAETEASCHPIVEELISKQVSAMRRRGKSRAEAEALILRFQSGRNYLHVLDAIYPPGEPEFEPPAAETTSSYRKRRKLSALRSPMARN